MGRYIVKLDTSEGPRYLDYSTVVDAPVSYGLTREEFVEHYHEERRRRLEQELEAEMADLPRRLDQADEVGSTSMFYKSAQEALLCNRAGKNWTCMTIEQIVEHYCVKRTPWEDMPVGEAPVDWEGDE